MIIASGLPPTFLFFLIKPLLEILHQNNHKWSWINSYTWIFLLNNFVQKKSQHYKFYINQTKYIANVQCFCYLWLTTFNNPNCCYCSYFIEICEVLIITARSDILINWYESLVFFTKCHTLIGHITILSGFELNTTLYVSYLYCSIIFYNFILNEIAIKLTF